MRARARSVGAAAAAALLVVASIGVDAQETRPLRVVVFDAPGVGRSALDSAMAAFADAGFAARAIGPEDVRAGALDDADVVLFTGGRGSVQGRLLGPDGRARVRRFVSAGGGYVGICAGSYLAMQGPEEFHKVGIVAAQNLTGDLWRRGVRTTPVVPNDGSEPVALHYANGPLLAPSPVRGLGAYVTLATFDADVYWERYGTGPGQMPGTPAVAAAAFGGGRVLLFSPNPTLEPAHPDLLTRAVRWTATRWSGEPAAVPEDLRWSQVFGPRAPTSSVPASQVPASQVPASQVPSGG